MAAEMSGFEADWSAPRSVRTWVTTRSGGVSHPPYDSLNLATHVGDSLEHVLRNREMLQKIPLPSQPYWLNQVHGREIVSLPVTASEPVTADGSWTREPGVVCAVMTADCLPVLLTNQRGDAVAALHAGWRGLAAGILEQGAQMVGNGDELMAWIGPAIGQLNYEVGEEVREVFCRDHPPSEAMFLPSENGRWLASMSGLARQRLESAGVTEIYGGRWDTYADSDQFFSYRRDGVSGRFATLIWIDSED